MDSDFKGMFEQDDEMRRAELIRKIEHSVENLTLPELEALYYDMLTKDYVKWRMKNVEWRITVQWAE